MAKVPQVGRVQARLNGSELSSSAQVFRPLVLGDGLGEGRTGHGAGKARPMGQDARARRGCWRWCWCCGRTQASTERGANEVQGLMDRNHRGAEGEQSREKMQWRWSEGHGVTSEKEVQASHGGES